jgi:hypothetical protein
MRDRRLFRRWVIVSFAVVAFVGLGGVEGVRGEDGESSGSSNTQGPRLVAKGPCHVPINIVYSSSTGDAGDGNGQLFFFFNYEQDQTKGADMMLLVSLPAGCGLYENAGQQFIKCKDENPEVNIIAKFEGRLDQQTNTSVTGGFSVPLGPNGGLGGGKGASWTKVSSTNTVNFLSDEMYRQGVLKPIPVKLPSQANEPIMVDAVLNAQAQDRRGKEKSVFDLLDEATLKYIEFAETFNANQKHTTPWIRKMFTPDQQWDSDAQLRTTSFISGQIKDKKRKEKQEHYNLQYHVLPLKSLN